MDKQVVFASNRSGGGSHFEIFVMNADGSDLRQLTFTPQREYHAGRRREYMAAMVAQRRLDRVSIECQRRVSDPCDPS